MSTLERLLLPTDFSPLAAHAASFARMHAEAHHAALHVIHVVSTTTQPAVMSEFGTMPVGPSIQDELASARESLDRFVREQLADVSVSITTNVLVGRPPMEIARYARESRIDLIVIGSHADGILHRILLGSTSKAVLESAPCAVLMVPLASMTAAT